MAGRRGTGTGWTISAAGGCMGMGDWMDAGAGTGVWMGACKGGRTSARAGEVGHSDSRWDSDLRPSRLNLWVQVPHALIVFVFGTVLV
jgi:hypothetical protein